jgi:hypothetical protein
VSRVPEEEWVRTEVPISLILLVKSSIMQIYKYLNNCLGVNNETMLINFLEA